MIENSGAILMAIFVLIGAICPIIILIVFKALFDKLWIKRDTLNTVPIYHNQYDPAEDLDKCTVDFRKYEPDSLPLSNKELHEIGRNLIVKSPPRTVFWEQQLDYLEKRYNERQ